MACRGLRTRAEGSSTEVGSLVRELLQSMCAALGVGGLCPLLRLWRLVCFFWLILKSQVIQRASLVPASSDLIHTRAFEPEVKHPRVCFFHGAHLLSCSLPFTRKELRAPASETDHCCNISPFSGIFLI